MNHNTTVQPDVTHVNDQFVNQQFNAMTAGLSSVEQSYFANVPGGLDAFMQAQTTFENFSLDSAQTQQAINTEAGMNALMAPSLTYVGIGEVAMQHDLLIRNNLQLLENNAEDEEETR